MSTKQPKQRSKNYTEHEKYLFVELIREKKFINTIESKQNSTRFLKEKSDCWEKLVTYFNADENVSNRDKKQLQTLWKELKARTKKSFAKEKREIFLTGGGKCNNVMDEISKAVKNLLPENVFVPSVQVNDDDASMIISDSIEDVFAITNDGKFTNISRLYYKAIL